MRNIASLFRRFRDDERGVFAVFFGLFAIVLIAAAGCVVDYTSIELARTKAQQALDAAALGLAPKIYDAGVTEEDMRARAEAIVTERMADSQIAVEVTQAGIDTADGSLRFAGRITVPMAFMQLLGIRTISANVESEATKGSSNLEVAVALDNTGSMENYIDDLKTGLDGLIGIVVSDVQEPTYSKMAIVPYAAALDVGAYANSIRTAPPGPLVTASDVNWAYAPFDISNATKTKPIRITTAANHNFNNGDIIYINDVKNMTALNGKFYKVANKTNNAFDLQTTGGSNVDGTSSTYKTYQTSNNDKVRKCVLASCEVQITSTSHGLATNRVIRITDTGSNLDETTWAITYRTPDTFTLNGTPDYANLLNYPLGSSGNVWCTEYGCKYYYFRRKNSSSYSTYKMTENCVTERMDPYSYTDDAPNTTAKKFPGNYTSSGVCDLDEPVVPLTSDKDVLYAASAKMDDHGSTAGHLGTAWGWYMVAPNFGYLWNDPDAVPAAYDEDNLMKVVILMTDGEYNIQYCKGVDDTKINNCSAPADATTQARTLCTNMKAKGIVVYTVGFNITADSSEAETMTQCASDSSKAFLPSDGEELIEDFRSIGQNITDLRLSR